MSRKFACQGLDRYSVRSAAGATRKLYRLPQPVSGIEKHCVADLSGISVASMSVLGD